MAMGKREHGRQAALWAAASDLPLAASHPFYQRLNRLLAAHGFDDLRTLLGDATQADLDAAGFRVGHARRFLREAAEQRASAGL